MNRSPLVSVIIPTFNRKFFVKEAVESVLFQTYDNYEVIVIDDGSTDNTKDFLSSLKPHIKYIYQENKGVSSARNCGAKISEGKFLAFLDSDDLWKREKLEKQMNYMIAKDYLISQTDETWIRNGKHLNKKVKHAKPLDDIYFPSLAMCLVTPSAVVIEKELFFKYGGFDESLLSCEDYDLWIRMSAFEKIGCLYEELVIKRGGHEDQLSSAFGLDRYRILSLNSFIRETLTLDKDKRNAAVKMLIEKCEVYLIGLRKREKYSEIEEIEAILNGVPVKNI